MPIENLSDINGLTHRWTPHLSAFQVGATPATSVDDPIGVLPDLIGNTDLVRTSTAGKPAFKYDGNGWAFARFDGADDYLLGSYPSLLSQPNTIAVFAVLRMLPLSQYHSLIDNDELDNSIRQLINVNDAGQIGHYAGEAGSPHNPIDITTGTPFALVSVFNGSGSVMRVNAIENSGTHPGDNPTSGLTLAARVGGNNAAQADIYDVAVFSRALNSTERADLTDYWLSLYGSPPPPNVFPLRFTNHHLQMMEAR